MMDENIAFLRTHRNNIVRQFIERRLSEEQSYYERLAAGTFPMTFRIPKAPEKQPQLTRLSKARQERSRNRWR